MILQQIRSTSGRYPRQFWLMFWGMLISAIGASMIWPFLMIYVSERLHLPLTAVASLMTLHAAMGLVLSFVAGPVIDRFGRKWVMVISLIVNGLCYLLMSRADALPEFALLMALAGAFNPLYRVGADAMMADLIPNEQRQDAFSLLRMSNNLGIALGPAIGGFIATRSYTIAFFFAAAGMIVYSLLLAFRAVETLPERARSVVSVKREKLGGYGRILRDRQFISFVAAFTLTQMCATLVWVLMAVYAKTNYGVPENQYGFIATTNAVIVVLFQVGVTQISKRYPPLLALAVGSLFYAVAVGSVALGQGFWGFWISMVVLSIGELILIPTSTSYAANLAPADYRGRYMSIYGLTWGLAAGIGPVVGGVLNDTLGPKAIWYGGFVVGLAAVASFLVLYRRFQPQAEVEVSPAN